MKAWTAGTICAKFEGFFYKKPERGGRTVDGGYYLCKVRGFFFIKKPERGGRTAGSILPEFKGFFAKCRDLSDLGRPAGRSNGRGQPATWPRWLPSFWCVNRL